MMGQSPRGDDDKEGPVALTLNEKLSKVLSFLVGLRDPRVFTVMAQRGFDQAALEEGWNLFTTAAGAKLRYSPPAPGVPGREATEIVAELDKWENGWFPVVQATLERHFPAVNEVVFKNLSQSEGRAVIVSVGTLLDRLGGLSAAGPDGPKALALIESRGLTPDVRKTARDLIARVQDLSTEAVPEVDPGAKAEQEEALAAAWGWYKEWATIARTLITRGDILIRLGLREMRRSTTEADPDDPGEGGDPPVEA